MSSVAAKQLESVRPSGQAARLLDAALGKWIKVDGVEVTFPDGTVKTYGDGPAELGVRFNNARAIQRLAFRPSLAMGQGYTHGDIDFYDPAHPKATPPVDKLIKVLFSNQQQVPGGDKMRLLLEGRRRHRSHAAPHYDISNDFYKLWLDGSRTYSCGYWPDGITKTSLEEAQQRKVDHILRKLHLRPGQRLLDIGSGWGNLALQAAKDYGVEATGITVSREQLNASNKTAKQLGLSAQVKFRQMDYRDLAAMPEFQNPAKRFDRVVSVGMYEHVGRGNHHHYFAALKKLLKDDGLSVLHTISQQQERRVNTWIDREIFPGGHLPTLGGIANHAAAVGFRVTDVENLREHYALTLDEWWHRFEKSLPTVRQQFEKGQIKHWSAKNADEFIRLWRFYLAICSGNFRYGNLGLLQLVMTNGINNDLPRTREHLYK